MLRAQGPATVDLRRVGIGGRAQVGGGAGGGPGASCGMLRRLDTLLRLEFGVVGLDMCRVEGGKTGMVDRSGVVLLRGRGGFKLRRRLCFSAGPSERPLPPLPRRAYCSMEDWDR